MGKAKQRLLLETYRNKSFYNKKLKSKAKFKRKQKYKHIQYSDLFWWSREVRIVYNHSCAYCGSQRLSTHHIFYKSKFPGLQFNLNNGIVLCKKCHEEVHKLNDVVSS